LDQRINHARSGNSSGAGSRKGVPFGIFPYSIKGWRGLKHSLTCRQGDFAEDLSEEGMKAQRQGQVDKQMRLYPSLNDREEQEYATNLLPSHQTFQQRRAGKLIIWSIEAHLIACVIQSLSCIARSRNDVENSCDLKPHTDMYFTVS
jgi:hypothetical protein